MNDFNFQRKWLIPVFLICSLLIFTSCGKASNVSSPPANSSINEIKQTHKLTIMLDWYPNAVHSFYMLLSRMVISRGRSGRRDPNARRQQ